MSPDRSARWRELVGRPDAEVRLDEGALLISAHAQIGADLDVDRQLARLDDVAGTVETADADGVVDALFGRLGLRGNAADYGDPANSYLDRVLDRRLGIPISLAVLAIEVGRRCGVVLEGVGLPGHYLVRDPARPEELIDAFDGGRRLDPDACLRLLQRVTRPGAQLHPALLAPAGRLATLTRMLANLEHSFRDRGDAAGLVAVTRLAAMVPHQPVTRQAQLAVTLAELGAYADAADAYDALAARRDLAPAAAEELRRRGVASRARLN